MTQAFNPYLPSWEYTPDGEPHVFDGRVYVYGSHDRFRGHVYCLNDYVCWSAPVDDLGAWRYEGVIYGTKDDPDNRGGEGCLFAPDVTRGPDGRYYLYYVLSNKNYVSVAVCDTPAGRYEFLGNVRYPDGTRLGERPGDEPQFDPGVLTEGDATYMYTGFCSPFDPSRTGPMMTVLGPDMLTVSRPPVTIMPSAPYAKGTQWEGHEFFEASSIRRFGGTYYFVYSSIVMHELCYATSREPGGGFQFGGVLVSNCDLHIDTYKPAGKPMYYGANNHGGLEKIGNDYYIFYHRHTDGTNYSRQGMAQRVEMLPDGRIPQVEMTSCGLNGGPLPGRGAYPAYIACNLFTTVDNVYTGGSGGNGFWLDARFPKITQDGRDGDEEPGYIANMTEGATCGFKYFDCRGVKRVGVRVRGYAGGCFAVKTAWDGPELGRIPVNFTSLWTDYSADIALPDGVQAIYLTYHGHGSAQLASFTLA
ncbi:MAG: family 43 glycosylhydrolase [Clostridia bacterium]|nr:family 43 glycosylhydrolase [Clostridia bacterium]